MHKYKTQIIIITGIVLGILLLHWLNTPYRNAQKLVSAIKNENIEKVEKLLEEGVDPNILTASNIESFLLRFVESSPDRPLAEACSTGNLEIVKLLIDYGATAEVREDGLWSPLTSTIFSYQPNDVEIVKLLLKNGADLVDDRSYKLPVFTAAEMLPRDYDNKNKVLLKGYSEEAAKGITEITILLLGDQSIDIQTSWGATLLILATKAENKYLVEYLIVHGCDTQIKDSFGKTAYDYAIETKNSELIDLLGLNE